MKHLSIALTLLLCSLLLPACKTVSGLDQPDGRVMYLTISNGNELVASTFAAVKYHNQDEPRNLWVHLDQKTVFDTRDMIFSDEDHLRKPSQGSVITLQGPSTIQLGYSPTQPLDSVTIENLALTYSGSASRAKTWHSTQWTISLAELERLHAAWKAQH